MATTDVLPPGRTRSRLSRRGGFRVVGTMLLLMLFSSAVPSPLYVIYQQEWHFSPTMLTVVFGVYAIAVLGTLLMFGALSDSLGRRPVLGASLALGIVSLILFITASGVGWLLAARVVQGLSVGLATGALSAALIDLAPPHAPHRASLVNGAGPLAGLALGSLLSGLLVQYAPAPTALSYLVPILGFVALAVALVVAEESAPHAHGKPDLRPRRVSIPAPVRKPFALISLAMIMAWALTGLYMSLVPNVLAQVMLVPSHLVAGLAIAVLSGAAALAQLTIGSLRVLSTRQVAAIGMAATVLGTAVAYLSVDVGSAGVFFLGTVVLGAGAGMTFLGGIRLLSELSEPKRRSELFAALYVVNYLAVSIPVILAGVLADALGLRTMITVYLAFVAVVAVAALTGLPAIRSRQPQATGK